MTRMTGPDCVVMCNLINTYIHTYSFRQNHILYQQLRCFSFVSYPVVYVVANAVRGMLDRKRSEGHLQSSNESITIKQGKTDRKKQQYTNKHIRCLLSSM